VYFLGKSEERGVYHGVSDVSKTRSASDRGAGCLALNLVRSQDFRHSEALVAAQKTDAGDCRRAAVLAEESGRHFDREMERAVGFAVERVARAQVEAEAGDAVAIVVA
jgi:hypothetical protein